MKQPYSNSPGGLGSVELEAERGIDAGVALARAADIVSALEAWPPGAGPARGNLLLELAGAYLDAGDDAAAAAPAREAFEIFVGAEHWEGAVRGARLVYLAGAGDDAALGGSAAPAQSIAALGQGIWLAVSMPVDPELTVAMLSHLIDETPPDADGAAVAAAVATFIADLRGDAANDELRLFTGRMLADVARRHSAVQTQAEFDAWVERLELDDPDRFLVRLRNVVDVLVQDEWVFDRDALRARMPE